jgi:GntR family transcriptional regulator, histidine utilization repressor
MSQCQYTALEQPLYRQVRDFILQRINDGTLRPGMRIESESELVTALNVSRMTVNRALRELTAEGRLYRRQGLGTFVATTKPQAALLEIQSIAKEIRARGGDYSCIVHLLQEEKASPSLAAAMDQAPYASVFHSVIVHKENQVPMQLGCRYVLPEIAPDFLHQDFTRITVSDYLLAIAPVTAIEHIVEALIPEAWIRDLLQINSSEPCLALHRKTWVGAQVATSSTFISPGSRYTLGGKFTPTSPGSIGVM